MSNDNSGTDGDDLPIISNGGWQVGAVYEGTDYHHVVINDVRGIPAQAIAVPPGSLFVCVDIVTRELSNYASGPADTDEYALLDVYSNSSGDGYKHHGACYWYAGHKRVRPEHCRFKEHQSPLMMLALLGTK